MKLVFEELKKNIAWDISESDNIISISKKNGVGVIQISIFQIPSDYDLNLFDELYDFSRGYIPSISQYRSVMNLTLGLLLDNIQDKKRTWLFAILNKERIVLLITYNSLTSDFRKEHAEVIKILNSLNWEESIFS